MWRFVAGASVAWCLAACNQVFGIPDVTPGHDAGADATSADASDDGVALELLAGDIGGPGNVNGIGIAARFNFPDGVAVDGAGNLYVADQSQTIRKITAAGAVTTLAGTTGMSGTADGTGPDARFNAPAGLAADGAGNVYVADEGSSTVRKITAAGVVTTLAGTAGMSGNADGAGPAARFNAALGVGVDGAGNVYVADTGNHTIRKVTAAGVVTTLAGSPGLVGSADGTGAAARFGFPCGMAVDSAGNIYVADASNNTVRAITPGGVVTTLAGMAGTSGSTDGTGAAARFSSPRSVAVDGAGNVYVGDQNNATIRKIAAGGVVTTPVSMTGALGSADGTGAAARFSNLLPALAADTAGNIYVADERNHTIRKIAPGAVVTTVAGAAEVSGTADGTGAVAQFNTPFVAVDGAGNVYVADHLNHTIRRITAAGVVTTLAGSAGMLGSADGTGAAARFYEPAGAAVGGDGNLYVTDQFNFTIRKVSPAGVVTTFAGTAGMTGDTDGTGAAARFNQPVGVTIDTAGNLYVADLLNDIVRKITAAGEVTTLAGAPGIPGSSDGTGLDARFSSPEGVAVDGAGIYVADLFNYTVRQVTATGVVTTLAGAAGMAGTADGSAGARFTAPVAVAVDAAGNIYVADQSNATIRKITPGGTVTTIAGRVGEKGIVLGTTPRFSSPRSLAIAGDSIVIGDANAVLVLRHGAR